MSTSTPGEVQEAPEIFISLKLERSDDVRSPEDDGSSSLSDLEDRTAADHQNKSSQLSDNGEEGDTEAETERLEETPRKARKRKMVHLSSSNESTEAVAPGSSKSKKHDQSGPAKLDGRQNGKDRSIEASGKLATQSGPQLKTMAGKKRKRASSKLEVPDLTAESLQRVSDHLANHVEAGGEERSILPTATVRSNKTGQNVAEDDDLSVDDGVETPADDSPRRPLPAGEDAEMDGNESNENADMEDQREIEADASARTEEELIRKRSALDSLGGIEQLFATFRDRIFDDRHVQLNRKLEMLHHPIPSHPEHRAMVEGIEQRQQERLNLANAQLRYKLEALQRKSVAERTQHHSQYMQNVREVRDDTLAKANKEWYQIQRERRSRDQKEPSHLVEFSKSRAVNVALQTAYNQEVSIVSGIAKFVGFPAAPEIQGATKTEVDEDFRRMGIAVAQVPVARISLQPRQRPFAEESFYEKNLWANPQHPASISAMQRSMLQHARPFSPFTTPAMQQRSSSVNVANGTGSTLPASGANSSIAHTPMDFDTLPHATNNLETPSRVPYEQHAALRPPKMPRDLSALDAAMVPGGLSHASHSPAASSPARGIAKLTGATTCLPRLNVPPARDDIDPRFEDGMHRPFSATSGVNSGVKVGMS